MPLKEFYNISRPPPAGHLPTRCSPEGKMFFYFSLCGFVSVCHLHGLLHEGDFCIRKGIEMARAFLSRESPIVLQTESNEEVDLPVGHVHDLLDGFPGPIVAGQERQFAGELRIYGLLYEPEERLCLERHVYVTVPDGRIIMNDHAAFFVDRVFHQRHKGAGKCLQRGVIVSGILQHGCRYGKHKTFRGKTPASKNVVDQESVDSTISILERVQEDESIRYGYGVNHGGHN